MGRKNKKENTVMLFFLAIVAIIAIGAFLIINSVPNGSNDISSIGPDGYQEVRMVVNGFDYEPSTIIIPAGVKVRWIIDGTNAQGCAQSFFSPRLGINQMLQKGDNIFEFTVPTPGTIPFSCSMGMSRGQIKVV